MALQTEVWNELLAQEFPNDRMAITYFLRDYNYSRFSYERFFEGIDKAGILDKWGEDTQLLVEQYDQFDNLGYYIPYFRTLNDSHCTTIFGFDDLIAVCFGAVFGYLCV